MFQNTDLCKETMEYWLPWHLLDNRWSRGHWALKKTQITKSGIFSKIPYATQQPSEMQVRLHSDANQLKWDMFLTLALYFLSFNEPFRVFVMAIKGRWLGEWNTSWPWWETDKLMCEPLLPSVCASAWRAFYNLCVCKWGEKQNLLNC